MPTSRGRFEDVILIGTRADQPAANTVSEGTLYSVTDEDNLVERSDGTAWVTYADAGGGGGSGTVTNTGSLTAGTPVIGNGGVDVISLALGTALQVLRVNAGATAVEFATVSGTGDVVGPAASVDKELALFDGTTGKLLERATGTGYVKVTSGVMGTPSATVPISTDVGGLGTGVATALAVNVGSAGAPVLFNGALGTPSSGTGTNLTGIPLTTGVTGDLPYANLAQGTALSVLGVTGNATADQAPIVAASDHQVLRRSGTAVAFGAVNIAQSAAVTGTLPVANGGTNLASYTAGDLLYATGATTLAKLAIGTAGQVLEVNGGATAPQWGTAAGGGDVSGPGSSTDRAIATWDGTGGDTLFDTAVIIDASANVTGMATLTLPNTGLHLLDTNASHDLIIAPGSNLTADHTLTVVTGDADRSFTLTADSSIGGTAYVVGGTDVAVADGGTGLSAGTSGGVLGYTASGTLASSVALTASAIVLGGGAGATPTPLGSLGTTTTVLHGNAAGAPTFGAVDLAADVTGDLPFANLTQGSALSVLGVTGNSTADNASIAAASDHQVMRRSGTAVAFGAVNLAQSAAVTGTLASANLPAAVTTKAIGLTIDGGGSTITTGIKADMYIPFTCTITAVTLLADQTGSIVIDIWGDPLASYPPTDADSITASAPPTITTNTNSQDTTLTGWQTTVTAGDTLRFNVDSVTSITRVNLTLTVTT